MKENTDQQTATNLDKEPYEPPEVTRIRLTGDEIAVTGCKAVMVGADVCRNGSHLINKNQGS
jgi:hypothetical protein